MSYLEKIVYLTEQQYADLAAGTLNGHPEGVQNNVLYITTDQTNINDLSGILPVNKGGTGATSFTANSVLVGNGSNAITTKSIVTNITNTNEAIPTAGAVYNDALLKSGGTMTGVLTLKASVYADAANTGALNLNNSNIYGVNSIYTADASENAGEGINFYRDSTHYDTLWMAGGNIYFVPNRALGTSTTAANSEKVVRLPASITSGRAVYTDSTNGKLAISATTSTELGYLNGVTSAIQTQLNGKQSTLTFDGTYNASSNKAATVSTVTNAINALDGGTIGIGSATKTITALSQTNGNVSATFDDIAFPVTSVGGKTGAITLADLGLSTAMHFRGKATVEITEDSTTNPAISNYTFGTNGASALAGDVILDKNAEYEYVWTADGTNGKWEKLGSSSSYALNDHEHDISITQTGTSPINLSANTVYTLTAGGKSISFTTPDDTNIDTKIRIYLSSNSVELPLMGLNSGGTTAAYASHTSGTKDVYGAIPSTAANRATINLNTGAITAPGGFVGSATSATSAGKWTTARTLTIGSTGKSVDGSGNVSWSLEEIGAAAAEHGTHVTTATVQSALGISSSGSTSKALTEKGTFVTFGTSNLTIGNTSSTAMAGNTTVTNVAISADTTTNKNYALVFGTTPSDGTTPTAAKTEGLQKNSAKFYVNPSTGNIQATTFNGYTLAAASAKAVVTTIDTSASLPTSNAVKTFVEGKGYVTSSGVTSITLTSGTGITVSDSGTAITSTGSRTISISGMNTSSGSTTAWLNQKGGWSTPTASDVGALASNTTITNVAISEDTVVNKNYAVVFGTTPSDGTQPTAAKTEGLQKNIEKFYFNPSSGDLNATSFSVNESVTLQYNSTNSALEFVFT